MIKRRRKKKAEIKWSFSLLESKHPILFLQGYTASLLMVWNSFLSALSPDPSNRGERSLFAKVWGRSRVTSVFVRCFRFPQVGCIPLEKLPPSAGPFRSGKVWLSTLPGKAMGGRGLLSGGRTRVHSQADTFRLCLPGHVSICWTWRTPCPGRGMGEQSPSWSARPAQVSSPQEEADPLAIFRPLK